MSVFTSKIARWVVFIIGAFIKGWRIKEEMWLLNQIHRKLIFLKKSKNQKSRTEKISDLAEFRRINIRTEKIRKFVPPKFLGVKKRLY